jgi:hypothetical protein
MASNEIKDSATEVKRVADSISNLIFPTREVLFEKRKEFVSATNNLLTAFGRVLDTKVPKS